MLIKNDEFVPMNCSRYFSIRGDLGSKDSCMVMSRSIGDGAVAAGDLGD